MKSAIFFSASLLAFAASTSALAVKPNIVLIVSDDMGYGDSSTYGSPDIPTPNIQDLADQGVRFTDAYSSAPVCAPSRAALMTGKYTQRFGFENNIPEDPNAAKLFGLPTDETTIAERLKNRGYTTGLIGKWHLGDKAKFWPNNRGFDYFYGFLDGGSGYFPGDTDVAPLYENKQIVGLTQYMTFALADKAMSFIEDNTAHPFFLYLSFNAPHAPREAPADYLARFPLLKNQRKDVAGMIAAMDDSIGQVKATLARVGLLENTLIVFASDNGGVLKHGASSNAPLSGGKSVLYEGGIRIPMIMSMRGTLPTHKVYNGQASLMDLPATFMALAGHPIGSTQTDGVNLMPYAKGTISGDAHDYLFWRYQGHAAVRYSNYKMIIKDEKSPANSVRLFNLTSDIGEKKNIAADTPSTTTLMLTKFRAWNALNIPPLW